MGICIPQGYISQEAIRKINTAYVGEVLVFESGSESHFMTASTTVVFQEQLLTPAFAAKRRKMGLEDATGLLLVDAFTGNFAWRQGEDLVRAEWARNNRVVLPFKPPGGWSARGQPCDAWHFQVRRQLCFCVFGEELSGLWIV
jgi:hypothetical protein